MHASTCDGCSCNTHCRAACNYHGTVCDASDTVESPSNTTASRATIKAVVTLGTCKCDAG